MTPPAPAVGGDLGDDPRRGVGKQDAGEADASGDFMAGDSADEVLARPRRRHGTGAVVGIGAGPDQRRIADPAPALAGDAAGRRRRGEVPVRIAGDRANRAVFHRPVEYAVRLAKLARALGRFEPRLVDLLEPRRQRERICSDPGEHDMRGPLHDGAGERDRMPNAGDASDRTGAARAPVHNRGVELDRAVGGEHGTAAGVELWRVLQHGDRGGDRVERAAAAGEDRSSSGERGTERGACRGLDRRRKGVAGHAARAAVHGQRPAGGEGSHRVVVAARSEGGNRRGLTASPPRAYSAAPVEPWLTGSGLGGVAQLVRARES